MIFLNILPFEWLITESHDRYRKITLLLEQGACIFDKVGHRENVRSYKAYNPFVRTVVGVAVNADRFIFYLLLPQESLL